MPKRQNSKAHLGEGVNKAGPYFGISWKKSPQTYQTHDSKTYILNKIQDFIDQTLDFVH
jgi:hypothetical protein